MIGRRVGRPLSGPWLAGEKARTCIVRLFSTRRQTTTDQLTERYPERLGLTIRSSAQFIGKEDGRSMHMALLTLVYGGVNSGLGENSAEARQRPTTVGDEAADKKDPPDALGHAVEVPAMQAGGGDERFPCLARCQARENSTFTSLTQKIQHA